MTPTFANPEDQRENTQQMIDLEIDRLEANPIELDHLIAMMINEVVDKIGLPKRATFISNYFSRTWDDLFVFTNDGNIRINTARKVALCTPYPAMNKSQVVRYALGIFAQSQNPDTFTDDVIYRMTFGGNAVNGSYGNGPHYGVPTRIR